MHALILEQITPADLPTDLQTVIGAASADGTLLRFKNAVLARVETNKNRDQLSAEFLQGVAETLPLMPIDIEHNPRELCGIFTAARMEADALSTDGIIYMSRYPEVAAGIQAKPPTHFLSIEASGPAAQCSVCGQEFSNGKTYCTHLSAKQASGAVRKMLGKGKAQGGAVTRVPAGSRTHFDPAQVGVLASVENVKVDTNAALELAAQGVSAAIQAALSGVNPHWAMAVSIAPRAPVAETDTSPVLVAARAELQTVQAALAAATGTLGVAEAALATAKNELTASQALLTERDATVKELQGKIDELEELLRKAKPAIGLTAIALGTRQDSPTTPIRVVANKK